jgi:hypothetical protein
MRIGAPAPIRLFVCSSVRLFVCSSVRLFVCPSVPSDLSEPELFRYVLRRGNRWRPENLMQIWGGHSSSSLAETTIVSAWSTGFEQ